MNDAYLTDLLDQLVPAEPLPAWNDVLGRARRARRRYALVAAALATLVLAPASWAVANAFEGSTPPQGISEDVKMGNALVPEAIAAMRAQGDSAFDEATVDIAKLHGVLQVQSTDGPFDLWAAPGSNGAVCEITAFEEDLGPGRNNAADGGCLNPPLRLVPAGIEHDSWHPNLWAEYGYTDIPNAATATMSLTDGQTTTVPVVEGWFLTMWHITQDCVFSSTTTIQDAGGNQLAGYEEPPHPADWCSSGSNAARAGSAAPAGGAPLSGDGLRICGPRQSVALKSAPAQSVPTKYVAGLRAAAPARPQSFYKIQLDVSRSCNVSFPPAPVAFYVPAAAEVRILGPAGSAFWVHLPPKVNDALRQAAQRLKPFAGPTTLTFASIDHLAAAEPSTYLRLFTVGTPTRRAPGADGWLRITLAGPPTPWSDGSNSLWISRRAGYLRRDSQLVRIPAAVAERVRRAAPIPR